MTYQNLTEHTHICPNCGKTIHCNNASCFIDPEFYSDDFYAMKCGCLRRKVFGDD